VWSKDTFSAISEMWKGGVGVWKKGLHNKQQTRGNPNVLYDTNISVFSLALALLIQNKQTVLFLQALRETDRFFTSSGVLSAQSDRGFFHYRRTAFSSMFKSRVGNILVKVTTLRININLDGSPITSTSHTHPSHSETSRLLTSSLSLGVPVPRPTQCLRGV
jgi:hypothetical protein